MTEVAVKAPGVIKGFGEHAVVYGKLAIAVAVAMYATVSIKELGGKKLRITLSDFGGLTEQFDRKRLDLLHESYKGRKGIEEYVEENKDIDIRVLPYATIAARLAGELGINVFGKDVEISSKVPLRSGCASSAACSTAFTVAILASEGARPEDHVVIDIARDGERVVHRSDGAGKIDVVASYYGGYVSTADGGKRAPIETMLNMVLVDTGPKKSTAETVGNVKKLYEKDRAWTERILNEIQECAVKGLKAFAKGDIEKAGGYMYRDHELLRELGVSSEGLDRAVGIARENGAYGAKLSGGGGGGIAVVICKDSDEMIKTMEKNGFKAYLADVSLDGARKYLG